MKDESLMALEQVIKKSKPRVDNHRYWVDTLAVPAFRHDPIKAVLVLPKRSSGLSVESVNWLKEPAVCGYRRLIYENKNLAQPVPVPVCSTPAVITGVGAVVGSYDGHIRLYSRTMDKVYWDRRLDSPLYASLVVDVGRRTIVTAATSGLVVCFDLRGNLVWSTNVGFPIYATPTVLPHADVLVIAAFHSRCIGLNLETGKKLFEQNLPEPWQAPYGGSAVHRDPYASPVSTASGNVIVCCAEHVLSFAPDGTKLWQQEIGHSIKASPVALAKVDQIAICPVDGRCIFFASQTGQKCGEVALGTKITASPAVSGNMLAVGTRDGIAFGLNIHTHEVVWTSSHGAPRDYTSFSVLPDGNFIATSSNGNVIGLSYSDGRFLWETSQVLGLPDHDPVMDITPMAGPDGSMYCGSYSGVIYHFRFQPIIEE
jgi:outer membrane protein assembly factor BamB